MCRKTVHEEPAAKSDDQHCAPQASQAKNEEEWHMFLHIAPKDSGAIEQPVCKSFQQNIQLVTSHKSHFEEELACCEVNKRALEAVKAENSELQRRLEELAAAGSIAAKELQGRVEGLEMTISALTTENESLQNKIEIIEHVQMSEREERQGVLNALKAENDDLQKKLLELVPENCPAAGDLQDCEQELERMVAALTNGKKTLGENIKDMENLHTSDPEELHGALQALEALDSENEQLQKKLREMPQDHAANGEPQDRVRELEERVAGLTAENESLQAKIELMEGLHSYTVGKLQEEKLGLKAMPEKSSPKKDDLAEILARKGAYCILLEAEMAAM